VLLVAGACSDNGALSPFLPDRIGAEELAGSWLLSVPASFNCQTSLPPFTIRMELARTWVPGVDNEGEREYLDGTWSAALADSATLWLQGWIEPDRRRLHLLLWQGVHVRGSVLSAEVVAGRVLDGRLDEPVPPYPGGGYATPSEGYPGGFANSRCSWEVSGERATDTP
jgi:hypothetical protein